MKCRMDKIETQVLPVPPNMIASLREGFDAVANKIVIILIPIAFDLLLWLGPHLQIKTILEPLYRFIRFIGQQLARSKRCSASNNGYIAFCSISI